MKCPLRLANGILSGFILQPPCQFGGLPKNKVAVEKVQGLKGCGGAAAAWDCLIAVRTVKDTKNGVLLNANLEQVDHSAPLGRTGFLLGVVMHDIFTINVKQVKSRAAHAQVQGSGNSQYGVANCLGLKAAGRKSPQVTAVGINTRGIGARPAGRLKVSELSICRSMRFTDQPLSMNSAAIQSSNAG